MDAVISFYGSRTANNSQTNLNRIGKNQSFWKKLNNPKSIREELHKFISCSMSLGLS